MTRPCLRKLKIADNLESRALSFAKSFHEDIRSIQPLTEEASGRRYFRASHDQGTFVVCFDPSTINGHPIFIQRAKELKNANVRVPEILKYDEDSNFTALEDIGNYNLLDVPDFYQKNEIVEKVLLLLNDMQSANLVNLDSTFEMGLESHAKKFSKILCKEFLDLDMYSGYKDLYKRMIPKLLDQKWANCHYDFERRNLHMGADEEIILLDFQDLGFGPIGIDLAGILIDHYYETNLELVSLYSNKFAQLSKFHLSGDEVYEYALWGALQRNLRIMGTLTSLYIHKNKKFRIMDLPRIISNSATVANEIGESELSNFLSKTVLPEFNERIKFL